jgi:hypothetical protein
VRGAIGFLVGVLVAASMVILSPATALASSCSYDSTTHTVSITFAAGPALGDNELRAEGGQITFDGTPCSGATVSNTDTINATGGDGEDTSRSIPAGGHLLPVTVMRETERLRSRFTSMPAELPTS